MALAEFGWIGLPLHQTSVTGLIIALGLLIDNAIVVVDEYDRGLREGLAPAESVSAAVRHLFVPLLASTLTTVLAFMPIVLAPGPVSEFVGPISLGVIFSVVSSFALSMTVIPALAGYFLHRRTEDGRAPWWRNGWSSPRLAAAYRRTLDVTLRRPWVGVAVSLVLPVLGFALSTTLVEQFFPRTTATSSRSSSSSRARRRSPGPATPRSARARVWTPTPRCWRATGSWARARRGSSTTCFRTRMGSRASPTPS